MSLIEDCVAVVLALPEVEELRPLCLLLLYYFVIDHFVSGLQVIKQICCVALECRHDSVTKLTHYFCLLQVRLLKTKCFRMTELVLPLFSTKSAFLASSKHFHSETKNCTSPLKPLNRKGESETVWALVEGRSTQLAGKEECVTLTTQDEVLHTAACTIIIVLL